MLTREERLENLKRGREAYWAKLRAEKEQAKLERKLAKTNGIAAATKPKDPEPEPEEEEEQPGPVPQGPEPPEPEKDPDEGLVLKPQPPTLVRLLLSRFIEVSQVWSAHGGTRLDFCRLCEDAVHTGDRSCQCPCHPARRFLGQ